MSFEVGQKVIYSDLSPWETAEIKGKSPNPELDWILYFPEDDTICHVQEDGMREMTQENILKLLPKSHPEREELELLA